MIQRDMINLVLTVMVIIEKVLMLTVLTVMVTIKTVVGKMV